MAAVYDAIGKTYTHTREPDARIDAQIQAALGAGSVLNVGAGTGSYERNDGALVALEPSRIMIAQRPPGSAPVVCARAEQLPFTAKSFDAISAILTVHHWAQPLQGMHECARVARERVVFLTIDVDVLAEFWLFDYFPGLLGIDRHVFPQLGVFAAAYRDIEAKAVPVPGDCRDGFLAAFWQRPQAYLEAEVRAGISTFAKLQPRELASGLRQLQADLASGAWQLVHEALSGESSLDLGYRLVICTP
jgi:ubiquinone/menaquinone biosynthesis C-methylase UbiE